MENILQHQQILITRGGKRGQQLAMNIRHVGGTPHIIPFIDFRSYDDQNKQTYIEQLFDYEWIIFTSRNGVKHFFEQLSTRVHISQLQMSKIQFAVVGEKTKEALESYGIKSTFMPNIYTAEDFAKQYFNETEHPSSALIVKGNLASSTIAEACMAAQVQVDEWIVYETYEPKESAELLVRLLDEVTLDLITFTSPSTFYHFERLIKQYDLQPFIHSVSIATIGKVTKKAVESANYSVAICPEKFTIDAMFEEICRYTRSRKE